MDVFSKHQHIIHLFISRILLLGTTLHCTGWLTLKHVEITHPPNHWQADVTQGGISHTHFILRPDKANENADIETECSASADNNRMSTNGAHHTTPNVPGSRCSFSTRRNITMADLIDAMEFAVYQIIVWNWVGLA